MSKIALVGSASGSGTFTLSTPNSNSSFELKLPEVNGGTLVSTDASGNVGLGVTPSAWSLAGIQTLQVKNAAVVGYLNNAYLTANAYFSGSNWYYMSNGTAGQYIQSNGAHIFYTGPSGTAGNAISFTQAMTLDASGNLGINKTSPFADAGYKSVDISGSSGGEVNLSDASGVQAQIVGNVTNGLTLNTVPATPIRFFTNGAERARLDSSGNFRIGNTNTSLWVGSEKLTVEGFSLFKQSGTPVLSWNVAGSGGLVAFSAGSTRLDVGSITTNGTTTSYTSASDYRLKENVQPMENALATITQLNPVTYVWKSSGESDNGFIAHELQAVCPNAVYGVKDAVDENGNPQYQGVDTSFLVATLVKAIQEQQVMINELKAEVAILKQG